MRVAKVFTILLHFHATYNIIYVLIFFRNSARKEYKKLEKTCTDYV